MSEAAQVSIQRTRQPDTKKRRSLPAGPPPSSARVPDAPSWDMYLDGSDEEDAGHSFLDPAEVVAPSKGKRKRNQPTDPLPNSAMPSDFRSSHTASGLRDGSNHSRPVLAGRRNPVPSRATSTDYGSNVTPLAGRRDPIPSRGTTTDYESNETTSAPKSYLSADRHKFARNVISSQSKPVPVIPSLPPSAPPSIVVKKPYHPSSTDRRTPAQPTVSSGWGDFLDASEGEASSSESEWSQEEDIIQL
ncbi:hypothetical protein DFS34DRAFT_644650 [Phlyctochytrium arcticum]|nr:hypothetical protein DFS34DRAFT_644650 [Phlyctochytrium arcticum]